MADTVRGTIYPVLPGNCPDAGYKLVSKNGFVEPPLTGENLEWTKDTAITEADKAQIATNTNNIALKANTADINGTTGKLDKTTSIQDIAVVASMPASPVSTTLYIVTGA